MKPIYLILLILPFFHSCHDMDEGYLIVKNAEYVIDSMVIPKIADKIKHRERIENQSPWVTDKIDGVLGTEPILYKLHAVKASKGESAARIFINKDLIIKGAGRMDVQLYPEAPKGNYLISLQVSAGDYTAILEDIYKFIIE